MTSGVLILAIFFFLLQRVEQLELLSLGLFKNHCLKDLNNFAEIHNQILQEFIENLKKDHPSVVIVYGGDHYNAYLSLLPNAQFPCYNTIIFNKLIDIIGKVAFIKRVFHCD